MHVVDESQVIVRIGMQSIKVGTFFQMIYSLVVLLIFKVSETKVILQLGIIGVYLFGFRESSYCSFKFTLLVQTYPLKEETFERLA